MEYNFKYIIIYGGKSPANFSINHVVTKQISDTRFVDSYPGKLPTLTDIPYKTLNHPNSTQIVALQSRKTLEHTIEVEFNEKLDIGILTECDSISIVDRNGVTIPVLLKDLQHEKAEGTTLSLATFTFTQILDDEDSISSHVETDVVEARVENNDFKGNSIYLSLSSNKTIAGETVEDYRFYTLFYPKFGKETILEDKLMTKTLTGNTFTLQTYKCKTATIRFFLSDINLEIFQTYINSCWYQIDGVDYGAVLNFNGDTKTASQTINKEDIEYGEDGALIGMTEVIITMKYDFYRHEL